MQTVSAPSQPATTTTLEIKCVRGTGKLYRRACSCGRKQGVWYATPDFALTAAGWQPQGCPRCVEKRQ